MTNDGTERIGLLGGTFNPIHKGHIHAAAEVRGRFPLDRVLLIPSSVPPHKRPEDVAAPLRRLRMVELAVRERPGIEACDVEIAAGGRSYSIQTLAMIRERYPSAEIFFILGVDAFLEIETWKEYRRVLSECRLIVISRPGFRLEDARNVLDEQVGAKMCRLNDSQSRTTGAGCSVILMEMDAIDISSSEIRNRIREERPIDDVVDSAVVKYIKENGLYQRNHE